MIGAPERWGVRLSHQTDAALQTVGDLVRWGASRLNAAGRHFGHGTDNAADEARVLVFHALSLDFEVPDYFYAANVTGEERQRAIALIDERIERGCPAAYLTGEAWFAGLRFEVDETVMVPRSPLAELILRGFEPWCDAQLINRVLDIGTGSGCIAIAIAAHLGARVDALDISPAALEVARRNVDAHGVGDLVTIYQSDVYEAVSGQRYDLIVSNPPYVGAASMSSLPDEYSHEPELAFAAGDEGVDVALRIVDGALAHLEPHGVLVCEVGESAAALAQRLEHLPLQWIEFDRGGEGVFVLTAADLELHAEADERR